MMVRNKAFGCWLEYIDAKGCGKPYRTGSCSKRWRNKKADPVCVWLMKIEDINIKLLSYEFEKREY